MEEVVAIMISPKLAVTVDWNPCIEHVYEVKSFGAMSSNVISVDNETIFVASAEPITMEYKRSVKYRGYSCYRLSAILKVYLKSFHHFL